MASAVWMVHALFDASSCDNLCLPRNFLFSQQLVPRCNSEHIGHTSMHTLFQFFIKNWTMENRFSLFLNSYSVATVRVLLNYLPEIITSGTGTVKTSPIVLQVFVFELILSSSNSVLSLLRQSPGILYLGARYESTYNCCSMCNFGPTRPSHFRIASFPFRLFGTVWKTSHFLDAETWLFSTFREWSR